MEDVAVLQTIENNREIIWDSDSEFLFEYQKAMLLALKELGTLDEMQYRYAEQKLKSQNRSMQRKNFYNSSVRKSQTHPLHGFLLLSQLLSVTDGRAPYDICSKALLTCKNDIKAFSIYRMAELLPHIRQKETFLQY